VKTIGIVAIGRNEGKRLRRCLESVIGASGAVVYVDSGSTDGSVAAAREIGAEVVELDMSRPFSAARARNEGFERLMHVAPETEFVQFVDGDCEIVAHWLRTAADELLAHPEYAVVCGRRRERHPDASVYNKLCDIEWNTAIGEAKSCGGDSMMRVSAFREAGGFNASVIAGEEPELCFRLREKSWKIMRLDAEMTLHDAAMTRFSQWWRRNVRAGHAYAQGAHMHGSSPQRRNVRQTLSNYVWGLLLPLFIVISAFFTRGITLLLLAMYPLLAARVRGHGRRRGLNNADARTFAIFIVLGKIPQAMGQLKFVLTHLLGRRPQIIEYKTPSPAAHAG
jgi:glycosyltransferase involved in cell wall biosynthesis